MAIRKSRAAAAKTTQAETQPENTEENTVSNETPNFDEPTADEQNTALAEQLQEDAAEDAAVDFDVDAPEAEDVVAEPVAGTTAAPAAKETKATRPAVPEGKESPVQFAKTLTEHLRKQHETLGVRLAADKVVAPQVVYSYIKNNPAGGKNPFPATTSEGRAAVVDPKAALDWWDAKDLRVAASRKAKAEKDAAKAAKANAKPAEAVTEAEAPQAELVEAE